MQFENRNIGAIIAELAQTDATAISVEQEGIRFSRGDIITAAQSLAVFFKSEGVRPGASIAIVVVDRLRGIEALIALWSINTAVLFLDPRQTIEEIKTAQEKAGIDVVLTDSKSFARRGGFTLLPTRDASIISNVELQFSDGSFESNAFILSTSGTTGFPRFRRVTHKAFVDGLLMSGRLLNNAIPLPAVNVGSLAFSAVLSHWIKLLIYGEFLLSLPLFFKVADLHQALSRNEIKIAGLPPVLIGDLLEFHSAQSTTNAGPAYPHLKRLFSLGGPISSETLVQAHNMLTPGVINMYSMTGVGAVSTLSGADIVEKPNSVGRPFPEIKIRIETEDQKVCAVGQVGKIIAKPDWKADAKWVDTGDLGWQDEDGFLFIQGRSDQIASRNSINVNLTDLEQDVKKVAGVRDCIAFSLKVEPSPDDLIFLCVEVNSDADSIKQQIKTALATYRRPDKILISPQLPRTPSNKIALGALKTAAIEKEPSFDDF